ncbi:MULTISPECIES: NrfD/PsrC family molybdoenzyme membrane anchor subunit [unclassified Adlercreutzia]|uniref:NrfD/PsrC family molybdoenzyme membrane anchor subunit n=1 Tax=unclassified Adlercreutzia TaxID=2636013 RepID=UPI0013EA8F42|nr:MULTISPECIES: NrfD/PsrC family molybdoenzyme membrane anchor subunit [unclassified Adlercreutzia]
MNTAKNRKLTYGILGVLTAIGVVCWIYQLVAGLGVTGMNNANSWGTYIIMFMFFVGLSAGGLIVASSAHVFHIEKFKKVSKPAVIVSTVCICMAGMFILIDLGGFTNVWRILVGPNPTSPLLWDMCVITIYLIINILDLFWMHKGDEHKVDVLSRFALPVAILVHSVTAWIFGLQIAKAWYTAIMAPIFVASAMDSGLSLLLLSLLALEKMEKIKIGSSLMGFLAGLLATCIAVDAYFIGCEVLTMAYPGAHEAVALSHMLTGATAPFFWFEVIGGLVVPFCILVFAKNRQRKGLVIVASMLVIAGVLCKRIWLLLTSFITPNIEGAAGITLGNQGVIESAGSMWALSGAYMPTAIEIIIVIGVLSLGVLAFLVLSDIFITPSKND